MGALLQHVETCQKLNKTTCFVLKLLRETPQAQSPGRSLGELLRFRDEFAS